MKESPVRSDIPGAARSGAGGVDARTRVDANPGFEHLGFAPGELSDLVIDSLASAIAVIDQDGTLVATNAAWQKDTAVPVDGLAALDVHDNFLEACRGHGTANSAVGEHLADGTARVIAGRAPRFEVQYEHASQNNDRWFLVVVTHLAGIGAVVSRTETTTHHHVQAVVSDLAFHDPLTGLPNRWLVLDRLRMALDRSDRRSTWTAVVFVDINDFKVINDTLGHATGDRVLAAAGRRLRSVLRSEDTCGRWGGDEFVMVVEVDGPTVVAQIVRRLHDAFDEPVPAGDGSERISVSVGVAMAQSHVSIERLLQLADDAMYRAKRGSPVVLSTALPDGTVLNSDL